MELLFIFTIVFYPFWIIRNTLFWISRWQLKEYQLDRFLAYLKEANNIKKLFFSPLSIIKWILLIIISGSYYSYNPQSDFNSPQYLNYISDITFVIFIIILFFQTGFLIKEILEHKLKKPVFTLKTIIIIFISLCLLYFLFMTMPFVWIINLLLIDQLSILIISLIVFFTLLPTEIYREWMIKKATKKLQTNKKVLVIGVTGSYGKTSTKEYLAQVLSKNFQVVKTPGTNNTPIGIAKTILNNINDKTEIFIAEVAGYRIGNIAKTCKILNPKIGVLTAVSNQHVSIFGSLKNTMQAKYELITSLPKDGLALFNRNSSNVYALFENPPMESKAEKILYATEYEKEKYTANIVAKNITVKKDSVFFDVIINNKTLHFNAPVIGKQNIENILPAIFIANYLKIPQKIIVASVAELFNLPKTMMKTEKNGRILIDDTFNASPESVLSAIEYAKLYVKKIIFVLMPLAELGEEGEKIHYQLGNVIGKICDYLYVTNSNYQSFLEKGIKESKGKCQLIYLPLDKIAIDLKEKAEKDDIIIFEGKEAGIVLKKF